MRFSTAWARVAAQNVTLKVATVTLAIVANVQLIAIFGLLSRKPIVIERACYSQSLTVKNTEPTKDEIKSFLLEALPMRFDSDGYLKEGFLAIEELSNREKEQASLKQRQMAQRIIISMITVEGKNITAKADRLVSIGKIKSALSFTLKISLQQTNRTESNPYGLVIESISQIEEKENK